MMKGFGFFFFSILFNVSSREKFFHNATKNNKKIRFKKKKKSSSLIGSSLPLRGTNRINFSTYLRTCTRNSPPGTCERGDETSLGIHLPKKWVPMLSSHHLLLWKGEVLAVLLLGFSLGRKMCRCSSFAVRACWGGVDGAEAKRCGRLLFPDSEPFFFAATLVSQLLVVSHWCVSLRRH